MTSARISEKNIFMVGSALDDEPKDLSAVGEADIREEGPTAACVVKAGNPDAGKQYP